MKPPQGPQALVIVVPQLWPSLERLQARDSMVTEGSQPPATHSYSVTVRDCVPDSSQNSVKPPQLPQALVIVIPQETPSVSRKHSRTSVSVDERQLSLAQL